ncbi:MAG TPA: metallophosphoesterase [Desulfuromonadaceae bacterium]|nr:metallophosphoesterase [Desulfuromonadaceae bacterium]
MKWKISRRKFITASLLAVPAAIVADAKWIEPNWLKVRKLKIGDNPTRRFIYFTDLHYKGDRAFVEHVVKKINSFSPDFVCFGGDIMEEGKFLPEALELLSGIKSPLFGVPGNHDYWSKVPFGGITKCFHDTGGAWLLDQSRVVNGINIIGATCKSSNDRLPVLEPNAKNVLLMHYPAWFKRLPDRRFDLMLAGHSHGGQVRIPFYGAIIVPFGVDEYDLGFFQTQSGPLYVNPGIGWFHIDVRFNCRPEITVIEI